jgi:hypothetical protein
MSMVINGTSGLTMPGGQTQVGAFTSGTAVASTSGTSIDFTSIPSWVKRITVMFSGVSTNGTSNIQAQIGSGSVTTTGYVGTVGLNSGSGVGTVGFSAGFLFDNATTAADTRTGVLVFTLLNSATNLWTMQGNIAVTNNNRFTSLSGSLTLSGALDRVRITTVNGTDTFDAGSINILYE